MTFPKSLAVQGVRGVFLSLVCYQLEPLPLPVGTPTVTSWNPYRYQLEPLETDSYTINFGLSFILGIA